MKTLYKWLPILFLVLLFSCSQTENEGPYLATGIKIGEVTQNSAIVWVRLTQNAGRVGNKAPMPEVLYKNPETGVLEPRKGGRRPDISPIVIFPEGYDVTTIEGAAPGSEGRVRIKYRVKGNEDWNQLEWQQVDALKDYATQFELNNLVPGKDYEIIVEAAENGSKTITDVMEGKFKTAPSATETEEVNFIVITCTSYDDAETEKGYKLYPSALKLNPDFFVHTGDVVYYDGMAKTPDLARWHWDRMYSFPNHIEFHRQVASYFMKDDHDTWMNDCYPGMETKFMGDFTYEQGTQIFLDEVPMGEKTYRTVRWGKNLQIWMVEGRDYRSTNPMPDGPEKTIWGKEQMVWFKKTVEESDATFKVLMSPSPIVGPDRENKNDNHSNEGFEHEGSMLRKYLSKHNMVVINGDRHWQYISKDDETGLLEIGCGAGSDDHAGGWEQNDVRPEHLYLNVVGGFLEGSVVYENGIPKLIFRHFNPDGKVLNEYTVAN